MTGGKARWTSAWRCSTNTRSKRLFTSCLRRWNGDWKGGRRWWRGGTRAGNSRWINHSCTGNFEWSRQKALEDYTLEKMRDELQQANRRIKELLGVTAESFAYPCGQTFVGRGVETKSYVPLVATLFASGRTWQDE